MPISRDHDDPSRKIIHRYITHDEASASKILHPPKRQTLKSINHPPRLSHSPSEPAHYGAAQQEPRSLPHPAPAPAPHRHHSCDPSAQALTPYSPSHSHYPPDSNSNSTSPAKASSPVPVPHPQDAKTDSQPCDPGSAPLYHPSQPAPSWARRSRTVWSGARTGSSSSECSRRPFARRRRCNSCSAPRRFAVRRGAMG
jgi:hypothetical protein